MEDWRQLSFNFIELNKVVLLLYGLKAYHHSMRFSCTPLFSYAIELIHELNN